MNYATWLASIANLAVMDTSNADFQQILPEAIDYAEQRLYRELDLLNTVIRDSSGTLTIGTRTFTLPQSLGRFVVTNSMNVITPFGAASADTGTRNPLVPSSLTTIDQLWPSTTGATLPTSYAMVTDQTMIVGPSPDQAYMVEVIGTIRPNPLSATNTTTYLTLYLPDLFIAASMVFISGWQKNFGSQSDDPRMSVSWDGQYDKLFASANVEENRKKYASGAWGSLQPTPIASPTR